MVYKMKQRLEQFLEAENISRSQFADSIKVARAGISHIMSGRNNPSYEFIVNTMEAYPLLNIEWLLTGKGNMYKQEQTGNISDDLFSAPPEEQPHISPIPVPAVQPTKAEAVTEIMAETNTEKKTKRVVLFYNDGTYEEFC